MERLAGTIQVLKDTCGIVDVFERTFAFYCHEVEDARLAYCFVSLVAEHIPQCKGKVVLIPFLEDSSMMKF